MNMQTNTINTLEIKVADFDLDAIFVCGQCFRWERQPDGSYSGIAFSKSLNVRQQGDTMILSGTDRADFENIWRGYFDLDRDYGLIKSMLAHDPVLKKAIGYSPGIRILRQEPWEALCSFIISQNNNIPRIRGIISRLCESFGEKLDGGFAFPSPEALCGLDEADLAPLRCGFRARYILDAAKKVALREVELDRLFGMPLDEARAALIKIKGVGSKVADCTLLFGCGRLECFPADVWIKRVLKVFYPDGFPDEYMVFGGIAQQYLFHYARCCPECGLN
jgi:N-glycosylase/DNA lyase